MEKPNMDELITRLKAEDAQNEAYNTRRIEEQRLQLLEQEGQRVVGLEKMIADWLVTMAAADYPYARLLTITSQKKVGGSFSHGTKPVEEQTVGWVIGSTGGGTSEDGFFSYSIELLVDGELIGVHRDRRRRDDTLRGYRLGSGFEVKIPPDGAWVRTQLSPWHRAEESIPGNLKAIAGEAGLDWNPDKIAPNPQGT